MKKYLTILLCLMLILSVSVAAHAAGSANMSLSTSGSALYPGDSFTVTVKLSNTQSVSNGGIVLKFDSSIFEITGGSCNISGATGEVKVSRGGGVFSVEQDKVISGNIFTIKMKVKSGAAAGKYTISGNASLAGSSGSISCSVSGTTITVGCKHSYGDSTSVDGLTHVRKCSKCGETKTENHVWGKENVTKAATCKEEGSRTKTCTDCGMTKTEPIPVTNDHKYGSWSRKNDSTHVRSCSVCGKQESAAHKWNSGRVTKKATCQQEGTRVRTCTGCGAEKTEKISRAAHSYGTCTMVDASGHSHSCTVCGKEETTAHTWDSGKVTREPTCTQTGEMLLTCTGPGCGATKTVEVPVAAHTYGQWKKVDETTHARSCTACDARESAGHTCDDGLQHDENGHFTICGDCGGQVGWQAHVPGPEPTETMDQVCTVCSRVLRPNTLHAHEFEEEWSADEIGHWHSCKLCDEKQGFAVHAYENGCDGSCDVCGTERTAPHAPEAEWTFGGDSHWHRCEDCGKQLDLQSHAPGEPATTSAPQVCTICGCELLPILPHDHDYGVSGSTHTHACHCGEVYEADAKTCAVCAAENKGFPWWIVCVAEAVCFGGVIAFLLLRKGKKDLQAEEHLV